MRRLHRDEGTIEQTAGSQEDGLRGGGHFYEEEQAQDDADSVDDDEAFLSRDAGDEEIWA